MEGVGYFSCRAHQEIVVHCFRGHLSRGAELGAEAAAVPRCDRGNARSSECGSEDKPADEQNAERSRRDASRSPPNPRTRGRRISVVTSPPGACKLSPRPSAKCKREVILSLNKTVRSTTVALPDSREHGTRRQPTRSSVTAVISTMAQRPAPTTRSPASERLERAGASSVLQSCLNSSHSHTSESSRLTSSCVPRSVLVSGRCPTGAFCKS